MQMITPEDLPPWTRCVAANDIVRVRHVQCGRRPPVQKQAYRRPRERRVDRLPRKNDCGGTGRRIGNAGVKINRTNSESSGRARTRGSTSPTRSDQGVPARPGPCPWRNRAAPQMPRRLFLPIPVIMSLMCSEVSVARVPLCRRWMMARGVHARSRWCFRGIR
jgi:hypothetical protein